MLDLRNARQLGREHIKCQPGTRGGSDKGLRLHLDLARHWVDELLICCPPHSSRNLGPEPVQTPI